MVRKGILGLAAGVLLLASGCATTEAARVTAPASSQKAGSADGDRILAGSGASDRFSSGIGLAANGGGTLSDSQDPIPIFPKDPSPVGAMRNPGNPGSSPLPSTNPVAAFRR